ncbi:hypothetical protein QVD17_37558 [Tagetes erecta]|uniref:Uncharacterized protein n=1 Tax=Tagetes erecta TaxID=13708 RepID=A0AAD8JWL9_TARER|nr:hypothetical protein QVD17_37558 [Tagetes erecta]
MGEGEEALVLEVVMVVGMAVEEVVVGVMAVVVAVDVKEIFRPVFLFEICVMIAVLKTSGGHLDNLVP